MMRARLRVYTISDQDNSDLWIQAKFPNIFYFVPAHGWNQYSQGIWLGLNAGAAEGPDNTKVLNRWLREHIPVGDFGAESYPPVKFGMKGDTPSFLFARSKRA